MAFSFPAIPDDLWAQWQARLFREDSKQDEDNLFGSFAFKQMADEEIGGIPQNWPTPSELEFPDLPEATGRVSQEALNPQPRQAPYDASASLLPATIESSDFNPQVQNAPVEEDPFTPSPRFQPDPGQDTAPTGVGSFLDSANEAMQGVFGQVGKTLGDFAQTAGKVREARQEPIRQVGGLLDTLIGGPEARKDEARFQEILNTATEQGYPTPLSPGFVQSNPNLAQELTDITTRQIITSMNPETPFTKGVSLGAKAAGEIAPKVGEVSLGLGELLRPVTKEDLPPLPKNFGPTDIVNHRIEAAKLLPTPLKEKILDLYAHIGDEGPVIQFLTPEEKSFLPHDIYGLQVNAVSSLARAEGTPRNPKGAIGLSIKERQDAVNAFENWRMSRSGATIFGGSVVPKAGELEASVSSPTLSEGVAPETTTPSTSPAQSFIEKWRDPLEQVPEDKNGNLKYPTAAATARKVIADMKAQGLDTSEAEAAMEDFHMIARSDYERGIDGAEEFHSNKRDAWDTFVQSVQDYDLGDDLDEFENLTTKAPEITSPISSRPVDTLTQLQLSGTRLGPYNETVEEIYTRMVSENEGELFPDQRARLEAMLSKEEAPLTIRDISNTGKGSLAVEDVLPDSQAAVGNIIDEVAPSVRPLLSEPATLTIGPRSLSLTRQQIADEIDTTGTDPISQDFLYTVQSNYAGGDLSPIPSREGLSDAIWMTHDAPLGGRRGIRLAIDKSQLDPNLLKTADNDYPIYTGTIPESAIYNLGESPKPTENFNLYDRLQEAARNKAAPVASTLSPSTVGGLPPSKPPIRPPAPPTGGGPLPPIGGGQSLNQRLVRTAARGTANIAGTATGARIGYGDPEDTSVSAKDRVVGTLTGALLGALGTRAVVGIGGKVLQGGGATNAVRGSGPADAESLAGAVANLTFKGFTKADAKAEEQVQRFVQRLRRGQLDDIPEGAQEIAVNTEAQLKREIQAAGVHLFDDPTLQEIMLDNAQANNFWGGIRGGRQSAEVQQDLANAINKTAWDLAREWNPRDNTLPTAPKVRLIAAQTVAQHRKINQLTNTLEELRALPDTDRNKLGSIQATQGKIAREMDLMTNLQAMIAHSGTETGRALQARQNLFKAVHTSDDAAINYLYNKFAAKVGPPQPGQSLSTLQQEAVERANKAINELQQLKDNGATPSQLSNFWAAIEKGPIRKVEVFELLRYNSLLSGPRTVEIAGVSNSLQLMLKAPRDVISTTFAVARGEASFRELKHEAAGALQGLYIGTRAARQILYNGISDIAWTEGQDLTTSLAARVDPEHWTSRMFGADRVRGAVKVMEIPGRLTQMPDEIARHIVLGAESRRLAARKAYQELTSPGATYSTKVFADRVVELVEAPTSDMLRSMQRSSQIETFKGPMGPVGRFGEDLARRWPYIGNILVPFYRTTYHLTSRGIDASPIGLIGTGIDIARGRYGPIGDVLRGNIINPEGIEGMLNPALTRRLYDGVFGSAFTLGFFALSLQGNISGSGPSDPQKKQMMLAQGWTPYSFKIPNPLDDGKPQWISYANLGPVAIPMALAAASAEAQMYGKAEDQGNFGKYVGDVAKRSMAVATEQTYLQSVRSVFDFMEGNSNTAFPRFAANFLSSLIPFGAAINTVGQAIDTKQRRANPGDIGGTLAGRFPGVTVGGVDLGRNAVPVAQDTLGREIPNSLRGAAAFNPIRASATGGKESASLATMSDYGVDYPSIPSTWGGRELTPDQQRTIQEMMGRNTEVAMVQLLNSSKWQSTSGLEKRRALIQGVLNKARQDAGNAYIAKLPKLPQVSGSLTEADRRSLFAQSRNVIDRLPYTPSGR